MENEIFCKIEFRQDESRQSPGRLTGVLVPYGKRAGDRPELFEPDSLYWDPGGIVIREMHNRFNPIVKVLPFLDGSELRIDTPLPDTQRARDIAASMKGDLPLYAGLSVEFSRKGRRDAGTFGSYKKRYSPGRAWSISVRTRKPSLRSVNRKSGGDGGYNDFCFRGRQ